MKNNSRYMLAAGMLCSAALASPASASFLGDTVRGTFDYPTQGTVFYDAGTQVIAPTAEFRLISGSINPTATVSANTISIRFAGSGGYAAVAFSGPVITDQSASNITGASLFSSTVDGFNASRLTFGSNFVAFNLQGLGIRATDTISATINFASGVPEPATWAMMLVGFGMVAGAARYRRGKSSVLFA